MDKSHTALRRYCLEALIFLKDPWFWPLMALGFIAWVLPGPSMTIPWYWLMPKALAEELFFRFLLQETIDRMLRGRFHFGVLSVANLTASLLFSLAHLMSQPPLWAGLVFFPSLVFGLAWDRYKNVLPCFLLHFCYNFLLFYRP